MPGADLEADIMRHRVPLCTVCNLPIPSTSSTKGKKPKKKKKDKWDSDVEDESDFPEYPPGIMKACSNSVAQYIQKDHLQPDITFFGEKLTDDFDRSLEADRESVDLLLVIGTSLKVAPVADILSTSCYFLHCVMTNGVSQSPLASLCSSGLLLHFVTCYFSIFPHRFSSIRRQFDTSIRM